MGPDVGRLGGPYDVRVLIEAYIYTQRKDFVHPDFVEYYASLLGALQKAFGVRLERESLDFGQRVLWALFQSTVHSLLQITGPWSVFLEAGLLHRKLEERAGAAEAVYRASAIIEEANRASRVAHREILYTLFLAIFGECSRVVTSEELRREGFDDSREPSMIDYDHLL